MLSAGALAQTRFVLEGLQVNEKKMAENLMITKGLIMSDAVRKNPNFSVNGKHFAGGWGVIAGADGKLYIEDHADNQVRYYLLGSYEIPTDRAGIKFRQKCDIKFDMPHTFKVKRPLNPMAHITFEIDLKSEPKRVTEKPAPLMAR